MAYLLYADDTTLLAPSTEAMTLVLHALEGMVAGYGLRLNTTKSVWMASGFHVPLRFADGTLMMLATEAKYFGCLLNIFSNLRK